MTETATQIVNLDDMDSSTVHETIEINPDANPMEAPPPVDDGIHRVKLSQQGDWGQDVTKGKNGGTVYLKVQFSGQILAEGTKNHNKRVFGRVNTLVFDGKTEMGYILIKMLGGTDEAKEYVRKLTNYIDLAKAFKAALASEPIIKVSTKWVAQRKIQDKDGNDVYEVVKSGQKSFPPDGAGGYRHIFFDPKTQAEVKAQAVIQDYFADSQ